jgi:hypothetical protein
MYIGGSDGQPSRIEANSSDFATGAVLSQLLTENGKWHPLAFLSKSLSETERNYEIHDKEMLVVMHTGIETHAGWQVQVWRVQVQVQDHQNCPMAIPYLSSQIVESKGSELAAHAGLSVLYSPSKIYNCIQKICTETLFPLCPHCPIQNGFRPANIETAAYHKSKTSR